ncbi:hypothetical protein V1517DRAFT_337556 [Lipomyces orientalis]|uniref:Uncharacterized protein n=1 Tax=Lipomyces orientalis TaxID=1233043 RepID=A0ACC3TSE4_9ASCO
MIAPPAGVAYNFIVDLGRKARGLGYVGWKTPLPIIIFTILSDDFVIAIAFVSPNNGTLIGNDVSFLYATYVIVSAGVIDLCIWYYVVWSKVLPMMGGYQRRTLK